jgi:hypothetical protein
VKPSPYGYNPSLVKKKRARLIGELLLYKKSFGSSSLLVATPDELETPMDATLTTIF